MDLGLAGQTALITGASKGIGRAAAVRFAQEGANVCLVARGEPGLLELREHLRGRYNVEIRTYAADLSKADEISRLSDQVGQVDILVNNAGSIPGGTLDEVDEERWRQAWDLKVYGYIDLTRKIHRQMAQRSSGTIVNVIGMAGERPDAPYIAGSTGNAGLMGFTRALGGPSLRYGVRVVGVNPGLVATERLKGLLEPKAQRIYGDAARWQEFTSHLPPGRPADPDEIATVVVFLASPRASYVSGTIVTVDAGFASCGHIWGAP
jgi:hypothetical protein